MVKHSLDAECDEKSMCVCESAIICVCVSVRMCACVFVHAEFDSIVK